MILAAVIVSLIFLYPTLQDYQYRKKLASLSGQDSITYAEQNQDAILSAKLKRIKLGLDLQGGMRVVLEVDVLQLLDDLAKNKDDNFKAIVKEIRSQTTTNDESIIPVFGKKFTDRGIRMSRYYGNIRDADNAVLTQLDGETANLMVTDPPYGVEYDPQWRAKAGVNKNQAKMGKVLNDDSMDWREA